MAKSKREQLAENPAIRKGVSLEDLTDAMLKPSPGPSPQAERGGQITVGGYVITPLGVAGTGTFEDWNEALALTFQLETNLQIIIGDLLVIGEFEWGKTYDEIAAMTGRSPKTLRNYRWVMGAIDLSLRRDELSYSHYNLIAGIPAEMRGEWIDIVVEHNLTVRGLRNALIEAGLIDPPTLPRNVMANPAIKRRFLRGFRYFEGGGGQKPKVEDLLSVRALLDQWLEILGSDE